MPRHSCVFSTTYFLRCYEFPSSQHINQLKCPFFFIKTSWVCDGVILGSVEYLFIYLPADDRYGCMGIGFLYQTQCRCRHDRVTNIFGQQYDYFFFNHMFNCFANVEVCSIIEPVSGSHVASLYMCLDFKRG